MAIHTTRPDLSQAFPAAPGPDTLAFLTWASRYAISDGYYAIVLGPALEQTAGSSSKEHLLRPDIPTHAPGRPHPTRGVNVVSDLHGTLGIGASARLMITGLRAAGVR